MFRILLIDDEKMALLSTEHSLPFSDHQMTVAARSYDAFEALNLLQSKYYDAAFVDIRMPGMSGLEMIKKCQEQAFCPECVVVSGYSDFEYMKQAIQLGAFDYCLKPIQGNDVNALLERLEIKIYQNRLQNAPQLFQGLSNTDTQGEFLRFCGIGATEYPLTIMSIAVPSCKNLFRLSFPEDSFVLPMTEQKAFFFYSGEHYAVDAISTQLMQIPDCRLAIGTMDWSAGQLAKLLEQLQTDLMLTSAESPVTRTVTNASNNAFQSLLEEVRSQYKQEFSLQSLAQKYNLSYSYCSELFKATTGFTFSKYVTQLRMKEAAEQLLHSQQSVTDICYQVGYHNYHHFVGMFKAFFNATPTEYRQQGGQGNASLHQK